MITFYTYPAHTQKGVTPDPADRAGNLGNIAVNLRGIWAGRDAGVELYYHEAEAA